MPELLQEILLKIKVAGFNAFSLYAHWGYHSPSPGDLNFSTGAHSFSSILTYAKDIRLYVLFRRDHMLIPKPMLADSHYGLQLVHAGHGRLDFC